MSEVDSYIAAIDEKLQPIVVILRATVTSAASVLKEDIKWNVPTYSLNKNICSIMAHKNHVNLQICHGAHIADADILEGTGKDMRHLKFEKLADVNAGVVKKIINQAIEIDKQSIEVNGGKLRKGNSSVRR